MELTYSFNCDYCGLLVEATDRLRNKHLKRGVKKRYCSDPCSRAGKRKPDTEAVCANCTKTFKFTSERMRIAKFHKRTIVYCSKKCAYIAKRSEREETPCGWCGVKLSLRKSDRQGKTGKNFCNRTCWGRYNVTHREQRLRSKNEQRLFELIQNAFPTLEVQANNRSVLGGYEIDIYLPSINFGIEWNGPGHYLPIYGENNLRKRRQMDGHKLQIAKREGIYIMVIADLTSKPQAVDGVIEQVVAAIESRFSENGAESF
jgi:hypothetical protein